MFPMFAIAQRLKSCGHAVSIAAESHHEAATRHLDIPLIRLDTGTRRPSIFSRLPGVAEMLHTLAPANHAAECETLLAVAGDHDLMVGNQLAYTGAIVSRKLGKPWVFCAPSPLAILSRNDPPLFPYIHRLQSLSMAYPVTQRPYIALARGFSRLMMSSLVRQQLKLGIMSRGHPRFEGIYSDHLNLLLTSPQLVTPQPDWPRNTVLTGFSWFEPDFMRDEEKSVALSEFLESGPPPVVFAPGGSMRTQPGQFFTESIKACNLLGIRAILVAASRFHAELPKSPDVLVSGYLPYSALLKNASALVHSGGIGAIGWALRFGVPSLIVPSGWDQYDNARRAVQQNLAMTMDQGDYKASKIAARLEKLLSGKTQLLQDCSGIVMKEDGAGVACARIESLLSSGRPDQKE